LSGKRDLVGRIVLKASVAEKTTGDAVPDACLGIVVRFRQGNVCEET
jgi:hypothetical protein